MADKRATIREMFHKAMEENNTDRAEGIAAAANVFDPEMDLKKRESSKADSTVNLSDEEEYEYQRFVDLMDPQRG